MAKAEPNKAAAKRRDAAATRQRILDAAKVRFSRATYEHVGLRDVATAAGADPALVARYFGSKEELFNAVATGAFSSDELFAGPQEGWGRTVAELLMGPSEGNSWAEGFDPFQLLLRSAVSPVASAVVARELHAGFVAPLARRLKGRNADARAALAASYIIGFATMRVAMQSPALASGEALVTRMLAEALQQLFDAKA